MIITQLVMSVSPSCFTATATSMVHATFAPSMIWRGQRWIVGWGGGYQGVRGCRGISHPALPLLLRFFFGQSLLVCRSLHMLPQHRLISKISLHFGCKKPELFCALALTSAASAPASVSACMPCMLQEGVSSMTCLHAALNSKSHRP